MSPPDEVRRARAAATDDAERPGQAAPKPEFDLASLPSLDSITAATDIRAFLAPGVPEELARAALRRAWAADPAIRDFKGLAENDWDFTDPTAMPGFGALPPGTDIKKMVAQIFGDGEKPADAGRRRRTSRPIRKRPILRRKSRRRNLRLKQSSAAEDEHESSPPKISASERQSRAKRFCAAR